MANPTATSAAATTMMKNTKICPSVSPCILEKDTNAKFTALSINSTHMKMMMAFFLNNMPKTPSAKSTALKPK